MSRIISEKLRRLIAEYLNASIKIKLKYTHDQIPDEKLLMYTEPKISGLDVMFYELNIIGDEFYASGSHILVINGDECIIYRYDENMKVRVHKKIEISYMLYKRLIFRRKERLVLYRIYLNLIEKRIYRQEAWFEGIMKYLMIEKIVDIEEYVNGIEVTYIGGNKRCYDEYLNKIEKNKLISKKKHMGDAIHKYTVEKDELRIYKYRSNFISKRKIGKIKQYQGVRNLIFLLTNKSLIVAKFLDI